METEGEFEFETPARLFDWETPAFRPSYDVTPDGKFVMIQPSGDRAETEGMTVVLNWFEELKRLAPGGVD